ncbi:hypothetical protein HMPREF9550_04034, partial [Escherichia coli MS 187-1]
MMLRFISLFVLSEHCVQDGQQFTHTVNQRHFFGFPGCWQMHVKRLYHRIKPGYLNSNIVLLKWMIAEGYGDHRTLERRIQGMEKWLANPELLEADADAEYAAVIDIDLADIKEPILCAPNDPDDARPLSAVQGEKIDEVFIGSCMTNIGHFRAAGKLLDAHKGQLPTRLWVAPPTRMDSAQLTEEGYYSVFGKSGARIEIPGCSL